MNQIEKLCSYEVDTQISVKKFHETNVLRQNDVINANDGKCWRQRIEPNDIPFKSSWYTLSKNLSFCWNQVTKSKVMGIKHDFSVLRWPLAKYGYVTWSRYPTLTICDYDQIQH